MSPERASTACRSQRGETLVESLIAIAVLSLVAIAAFQGLSVATKTTADHRDQAVAETLLRSAAEHIQGSDQRFLSKGGCPDDPIDPDDGVYSLPPLPADLVGRFSYEPILVEAWTGTVPTEKEDGPLKVEAQQFAECPGGDSGLQRVTIEVNTPKGTEELVLLKRRTNVTDGG